MTSAGNSAAQSAQVTDMTRPPSSPSTLNFTARGDEGCESLCSSSSHIRCMGAFNALLAAMLLTRASLASSLARAADPRSFASSDELAGDNASATATSFGWASRARGSDSSRGDPSPARGSALGCKSGDCMDDTSSVTTWEFWGSISATDGPSRASAAWGDVRDTDTATAAAAAAFRTERVTDFPVPCSLRGPEGSDSPSSACWLSWNRPSRVTQTGSWDGRLKLL